MQLGGLLDLLFRELVLLTCMFACMLLHEAVYIHPCHRGHFGYEGEVGAMEAYSLWQAVEAHSRLDTVAVAIHPAVLRGVPAISLVVSYCAAKVDTMACKPGSSAVPPCLSVPYSCLRHSLLLWEALLIDWLVGWLVSCRVMATRVWGRWRWREAARGTHMRQNPWWRQTAPPRAP